MDISGWLTGMTFPNDQPLLDVSQAAPSEPPPPRLRQALSELILTDDSVHLYGPVLGNDDLRFEFSNHLKQFYKSENISQKNIGITSGCNEAFAAVISTLASQGDEIILPSPWYFNHKMWLDITGIKTVILDTGENLTPEHNDLQGLITKKTKAVVLVTPNNPTGLEYPEFVVSKIFDACTEAGISLVIDETYKDFDIRPLPPHNLFSKDTWAENFIHLYSFSKVFRLTGHRVGAIATSHKRLVQVEKFLDTVTICPNQLAQKAAVWGLRNLSDWVSFQKLEILKRRSLLVKQFKKIEKQGWELSGIGAYFAYVKHPFNRKSDEVARRLLDDQSILSIPGTLFSPKNSGAGDNHLRIAFANISCSDIVILIERLKNFRL